MMKSSVKVSTTKQTYPDKSFEEIERMVKELNDQRKGVVKK